MKTITLTDDQFDTLFDRIDKIARTIVDASVEYQDSEMLEEWKTCWMFIQYWSKSMTINTPHNVTLTEGQIGIILCSLEDSVKKSEHFRQDRVKGQSLQPFDDYVNEVDSIFEILEGSVDRHYDKIEKAQASQPVAEW